MRTCWCSAPCSTPCTVPPPLQAFLWERPFLLREHCPIKRTDVKHSELHLLVQSAVQHALHGAVLGGGLLCDSFWARVLHRLHRLLRRLPRCLGLLPLLQFHRIFPDLN